MIDLTLRAHTARHSAIVSAVLARKDHRAFVFGADTTDDPKRVQNWGWLRRIAQCYSEPALLHPAVGTTFYVREWRYRPSDAGSGGYARIQKFDPITDLSTGIQVPTCAIGGLDWATIPTALAERSRRVAREWALADERMAS